MSYLLFFISVCHDIPSTAMIDRYGHLVSNIWHTKRINRRMKGTVHPSLASNRVMLVVPAEFYSYYHGVSDQLSWQDFTDQFSRWGFSCCSIAGIPNWFRLMWVMPWVNGFEWWLKVVIASDNGNWWLQEAEAIVGSIFIRTTSYFRQAASCYSMLSKMAKFL